MADHPALDVTFVQDEGTPVRLELTYACLDDFDPVAIHEHETGDGLRVFFRSAAQRDAARTALDAAFGPKLRRVAAMNVPDEGWARRSQAQLTPVQVGRIVVTPPWIAPDVPDGTIAVIIEPSMGFGTGHHATTRLCLQLLQAAPLDGRDVVDVGTGSGVLAIAAHRLGARQVTAVDCDPDALQNARENATHNGMADAIAFVEADLNNARIPAADVVVANLTAGVLQREAATLVKLVRSPGRLLVSGFAPDDLSAIEAAFHLRAATVIREQAWVAAEFPISPPAAP